MWFICSEFVYYYLEYLLCNFSGVIVNIIFWIIFFVIGLNSYCVLWCIFSKLVIFVCISWDVIFLKNWFIKVLCFCFICYVNIWNVCCWICIIRIRFYYVMKNVSNYISCIVLYCVMFFWFKVFFFFVWEGYFFYEVWFIIVIIIIKGCICICYF